MSLLDINIINSMIDTVGNGYLQNVLPLMQDNGNKLLGLLSVIALSWFGIQTVLSGGDVSDILGGFVRQIFIIFLAFFFINDGYLLVFKTGIGESVTMLSEQLLFGSNLNDTSSSFFGTGDALLNLINQIIDESSTPFGAIADFLTSLPELGSLLIAWLLLTLAGVIFFGIAIASQLLIVIALSFGPVMIPFLVLPITSKWFDGWLNFLVGSGFWKIISAALLGIVSKMIVEYNKLLYSQIGQGIDNLPAIFNTTIVLIITIAAAVFLFFQIPSLAGAISSGTGIHSVPGFRRSRSGNNGTPPGGGNPPSGGAK